VTGKQLDEEEMIKLDIHLKNDPNRTWQETLLCKLRLRNELEQKSDEYRQNTDITIRPISLIQLSRTGKDQIDGSHIHSEHVKKYLIEQCGVPPEQIAIKHKRER
jgi:type III restriction enzyme